LQYWPRRRARRIYPRISHWVASKELKPLGFAAWKAGMTHIQIIDNNPNSPNRGKPIAKPATILDSPPLLVCGLKVYQKTDKGLVTAGEKWIEKFPKALQRKIIKAGSSKEIKNAYDVRLIVSTQPEKSGMHKKKPEVFELAIGGEDINKKIEYAETLLGKEITAKDVFKPGEFIDITAVTKGHGFTGPVKRFGIRLKGRKDQQMHRHIGSLGSTTPRKVDWRNPAAGQYGFFIRTESGKKIVAIGDNPKDVNPKGGFLGYGNVNSNYVIIEGSLPGHRKRLIRLRKTARKRTITPLEVKYISLESKQGK
jgi:large subunit ribosomal protein L3